MKRISSRSAFTLVELLTVIGIVGILSAIIIPVVGAVRQSFRKSTAVSNLHQVGLAITQYAGEHRGRVPGPGALGITGYYQKPSDAKIVFLAEGLAPYLGTPIASELSSGVKQVSPVLICPGASVDYPDPVQTPYYIQNYTLLTRYTGAVQNVRVLGDSGKPDDRPPVNMHELDEFGGASRVWVLTNLDKQLPLDNSKMASGQVSASGWYTAPDRIPAQPVWGNSRLRLYFDSHVASVPRDADP